MHQRNSDARSRILQMEREATEFAWRDAGADLAKLDEFAKQHHPDGRFNLIEDFYLPEDPHAEGWFQMSPVIVAWQQWLEEKYDRNTAFVILAKFGRVICGGGGTQKDPFFH